MIWLSNDPSDTYLCQNKTPSQVDRIVTDRRKILSAAAQQRKYDINFSLPLSDYAIQSTIESWINCHLCRIDKNLTNFVWELKVKLARELALPYPFLPP